MIRALYHLLGRNDPHRSAPPGPRTVSEATVRTHLQHIYTKLDIHSARELMIANADQLAGSDSECSSQLLQEPGREPGSSNLTAK